ncbi:MAG TPA: NAD-dependent epimerase/dehydratase family protein, partial [Thermoanaerobaculia bacterium]|nr:NAD-dependent epimerase/dehydratase family protein [Thermoanaerobaculia bacterium]
MSGKTVFVTGATGYMGRALIPRLLARGHHVLALARSGSESRLASGAEAVRFVVTPRGGHAGFVAANGLTPAYWAEELVVDFLAREGG